MAQERSVTPEKQLLGLIEGPKINASGARAQIIKHHSLSFFSFSAWMGRVSFFKDEFRKLFHRAKPLQFDIKSINSVLILLVLILSGYFLSTLFSSIVSLKKNTHFELKAPEGTGSAAYQDTSLLKKAASYYLEKVRQRDIFKMGQNKKGATEVVSRGPSSRIIEVTQHLKLVGISWSDDPDAMIEDTKALRTFFVKRGGFVGEIKVQAIFKDKLILSYAGEETELR